MFFKKVLPCLVAMCLVGSLALAVDQEVGAGKTHATIQAAIDAAANGDRIVVFSGTYTVTAGITWNKVVDIVEAPGETAILAGDVGGGVYYVNPVGAGTRTWDGIDIQMGTCAGVCINNSGPMTFKNMSVNDDSSVWAGAGLGWVQNQDTLLDNVNIHLVDFAPGTGMIHLQGATAPYTVTLQDSVMEVRGMMVLQTNLNGRFHALRSTMKHPTGGAQESYMTNGVDMVGDTAPAFTYEDSHILGSVRSIGLGLDNMNVTGIRSVFEFPVGLAINGPRGRGNGWIHSYTNCAWLWGGKNTFPAVILNPGDGGDGTVILRQCTLATGVTTTPNSSACVIWSNSADPGFIVDLTIENCILDLKGSTKGIHGNFGAAGTTSTDPSSPLQCGTNLRTYLNTLTSGSLTDKLNGTIIDVADAGLAADHIHLTDFSPALGKGANLGITTDIDSGVAGQIPRPFPAGSLPDLGCDENYLVPVELSTFQLD